MKLIYFFIFLLSHNTFAENNYRKLAALDFQKMQNTLTVHVIPSTYRLDWSTPRALIFSLIKNEYWFPKTKSSLGHVSVELNCNIQGKKIHKFIGQSSPDLEGFQNYIMDGYGFSILNSPEQYQDIPLLTIKGKLDDYNEMKTRFNQLIEKGHIGFLSFGIDRDKCQKVASFISEYELKTKETNAAGNVYGFGADPLKFEGAGCAPMVKTILELANLSKYSQKMKNTVFIDESLIGDLRKNKKVKLWSLLSSSKNIKNKSSTSRKFDFPDPQGLFDYITKVVNNEVNDENLISIRNIKNKNVWSIVLDTRTATKGLISQID